MKMKKTSIVILCAVFIVASLGWTTDKSTCKDIEGTYFSITHDTERRYSDSQFMRKIVIENDSLSYRESTRYYHVSEYGPFAIEDTDERVVGKMFGTIVDKEWKLAEGPKKISFLRESKVPAFFAIGFIQESRQILMYAEWEQSGYYKKSSDKDKWGHHTSSVIEEVERVLMQDFEEEYKDVIGAIEGFTFCDKKEYDAGFIEEDDYWYIEGYVIVDESKLYAKSSWESPNGKFKDEFRVILRYTDEDNYEVIYFDMN